MLSAIVIWPKNVSIRKYKIVESHCGSLISCSADVLVRLTVREICSILLEHHISKASIPLLLFYVLQSPCFGEIQNTRNTKDLTNILVDCEIPVDCSCFSRPPDLTWLFWLIENVFVFHPCTFLYFLLAHLLEGKFVNNFISSNMR